MEMEINCIKCKSNLQKSDIEYTCKHFLCNTCLSREILLSKFSSIIKSDGVLTFTCPCNGGTLTTSLDECFNILSHSVQSKSDKICSKHSKYLNLYCADCRIWLCENCVKQFHDEYFKNHQVSYRGEQLRNSKCFYHREEMKNCICKKCNSMICEECIHDINSEHINHATFTVKEYQKVIKNKKKELKYRNYNDLEMFINDKKTKIFKDFNMNSLKIKNMVDKGIKILTDLRDNYVYKTSQNLKNLNAKFNIIKKVYENFYNELNDDKLNMTSLEFISKIKKELENITFTYENFDTLINAIDTLPNINTKPIFELDLSFRKLHYDKISSFDTQNPITSLCYITNNSSLVCGLQNGNINVYKDKDTIEEKHLEIQAHTAPVNIITELVNTKEGGFISGSSDKIIRVWNYDTTNISGGYYDKMVNSFSTRTDTSTQRSEKLAQSTKDNNMKINCLYTISSMHLGSILGLIELSNGSIASTSSDNTIKIWEMPSKEDSKNKNIKEETFDTSKIKILEEGAVYENCLLQIDYDTIASGSGDGRVKLWSIKCSSIFKFLIGHSNYVNCLLKISNTQIVSGGADAKIILWNLPSDNNKILYGHMDIIQGLTELPHNRMASCSNDKSVRIWDLNDLSCLYCIKNAHSSVVYGIVTGKKNRLITGGNDSKINVFDGEEDTENIRSYGDNEENYDDFS